MYQIVERKMRRFLFAAGIIVALGACAHADDKQPGLDKIKKLAGEWVALDDKGKPTDQVVSVFKITAGGSAVQETIFPGKGEEMVSVYHMDGKDLIMTHYCMLGNQPKMKLDPKSKENQLKFDFAGGTNLDPAKDMHMHEGLITIIDDNHIEWSWAGYMDGKPSDGHKVSMKLERKKK
jgi:hypothetical protein